MDGCNALQHRYTIRAIRSFMRNVSANIAFHGVCNVTWLPLLAVTYIDPATLPPPAPATTTICPITTQEASARVTLTVDPLEGTVNEPLVVEKESLPGGPAGTLAATVTSPVPESAPVEESVIPAPWTSLATMACPTVEVSRSAR